MKADRVTKSGQLYAHCCDTEVRSIVPGLFIAVFIFDLPVNGMIQHKYVNLRTSMELNHPHEDKDKHGNRTPYYCKFVLQGH